MTPAGTRSFLEFQNEVGGKERGPILAGKVDAYLKKSSLERGVATSN